MIAFVFVNALHLHHYGWIALLNGPLFLVCSYYEHMFWQEHDFASTGILNESRTNLRLNRAAMVVAGLTAAQYLQQREFSIAITKQVLVQRQQAQLNNLFQSQRDGIVVYS